MANNDTTNVKLGVCKVFFGGVDLGFTKGGVEVSVETETHEVQIDQYGNTPIDEYITGRTVNVSVPLAETTLDNLVAIMPGAKLETDASANATKVLVPTGVGVKLKDFAKELILVPKGLNGTLDYNDAVRIPKAATPGAMTFAYKLDEERIFNCTFKGYPVTEGTADNATEVLYQVGKATAPVSP
ncbi:hypothetical protein [Acinetobacter sp. A47]|uniref:hypothetical protein n=1 Tax=Acinetobacter sp. A47 TaxID=1561217 RepID=UPI00056DEBBD|nr:hypothetical protein [Acinetobacter sp. A47]